MKVKLLSTALVALSLLSCNKEHFNVSINLQNAEGKSVYLQKLVDNEVVVMDSAVIKNNIADFKVDKADPVIFYSVRIEGVRYPIGFFSENQDIDITGDFNDNRNITANGSDAQQLISDYNAENNKFNNQLRELRQQYGEAAQSNNTAALEKIENDYNQIENNQNNYRKLFLTKNSNSIVAPYILYNNRYNYELNELEDFVSNFNVIDNDYSKKLDEYIAVLQRVDVGQPYLDFSQETPDGDMLSLSELVGKSKLLLVDFWASWCGPCRAENPNVVKAYNNYHEKGFDVLGVSLDMEKENWIKAIEDDGLIWHNISDLKYWNNEAAKAYGISSIPSNLLLDENGTIVAKNLRGDDLDKFIGDYLK